MGDADNLVLQQLRLIRDDIAKLREEIADVKGTQQGQTGILISLGHYIHSIDDRVERLEAKIGA